MKYNARNWVLFAVPLELPNYVIEQPRSEAGILLPQDGAGARKQELRLGRARFLPKMSSEEPTDPAIGLHEVVVPGKHEEVGDRDCTRLARNRPQRGVELRIADVRRNIP
jgi:hypothetical protein